MSKQNKPKNITTLTYCQISDRPNLSRKGFTLMEVVIYLGILSMIMVGFISFFLSINSSRNKNFVMHEVQANNRIALEYITQFVKASNGINTGSSTFDSDPGILSLAMDDVAKNPTIISLDVDDGVIQVKEGASDAVAIVSGQVKVTNLVFTNLTSISTHDNVRVVYTTEYNSDGSNEEYVYSQSMTTAINVRK